MASKTPLRIPVADGPTKMEGWYLRCLEVWWRHYGIATPPTIDSMGEWLRKSRSAIYSALIALEHKGLVERVGGDSPHCNAFIPVSCRDLKRTVGK